MMMKSRLLLLLLFGSGVSGLGTVVWRSFQYIERFYNWSEAQSFCRSQPNYKDLATYYKQRDRDQTHLYSYSMWVGLYKIGDKWQWVDGPKHKNSFYGPWDTNREDTCAYSYSDHKRYYEDDCENPRFFVCYTKKGPQSYRYTLISESMTWSDARQHCQNHYRDLAVIDSFDYFFEGISEQEIVAWTGLHRYGNMWTWSAGLSEYREWGDNQPDDHHDCVTISSRSKDMATRNCSSRLPFVCFSDNLILVKENKTWEESLEHCRDMRSDYHQHYRYELVSVQPGYEHSILMAAIEEADTKEVWAGLRFMEGHWWWVNGADMNFDLPVCPVLWQNCGALSRNDTAAMKNRDCLERKNFLCYRKN